MRFEQSCGCQQGQTPKGRARRSARAGPETAMALLFCPTSNGIDSKNIEPLRQAALLGPTMRIFAFHLVMSGALGWVLSALPAEPSASVALGSPDFRPTLQRPFG